MPKIATKNRISQNGHAATTPAVIQERKAVEVNLVRPDIRTMELSIKGATPLVVHAFSAKSTKQIEEKQQQKAKGPREKRDPQQEYLDSFYMMPGSPLPESKGARYGIPAAGFKRACEGVCRGGFVSGMSGTFVVRAFSVLDDGGGLVEIKCSKPFMRTDIVRIGKFPNKVPQPCYRPEFSEWSCKIRIRYNATVISSEQITNIFQFAGIHEGWGELRPGKGYSNGQWELVNQ